MHLGFYPMGVTAMGFAPRARMIAATGRRPAMRRAVMTRRTYLGDLGLSPEAQGAAGGAAAGAKVGSAIMPGIGTAIGAVVGGIAGAIMGGKDPNKAEKRALSGDLDQYINLYMGRVPGRAFGVATMEKLIDAAGYRKMWPGVKKWSGDAIHGAIYGCKGCTPPPLVDWVREQIGAGNINPTTLVDPWGALVQRTWGTKWFVPAGNVQRQLIIDLLDALIANQLPNAPLFYAVTEAPPAAVVTPAPPAPAPMPLPIATPAPAPLPMPGATPAPPTQWTPPFNTGPVLATTAASSATTTSTPAQVTTAATSGGPATLATPDLSAQIQQGIAQMMGSGASAQTTYQATLDQLSANGVAVTPAVQGQVANQVATQASVGSSGGLMLAGLAVGLFVLMGGGSRKRSASA